MGTQVGHIVKEFVFKSVIDQDVPLRLHGHKRQGTYKIVEASSESMELECLAGGLDNLKKGDPLQVFFFFQNNHHAFHTAFRDGDPMGKMTVEPPEGVYKDLERKYERVKVPEGMEIHFTLHGQRVDLGFPRSQNSAAMVQPPDMEKEDASLQELIGGFRQEMSEQVSENKIQMFRERGPSDEDEKLFCSLGKVLWIEDMENDLPVESAPATPPIITQDDFQSYEDSLGTAENLIDTKRAHMLLQKREQGLVSEVFAPLLYDDLVLGYVRIANREPRKETIPLQLVDRVWRFSRVLCYALGRHNYIDSLPSGEQRYNAPLIDISASGLLFSHPSEELAMELLINTDIELHLTVDSRQMQIGARIRRKLNEPGMVCYGAQFVTQDPDDFHFLFEFLYGRPFTTDDAELWEGGAPPPTMDLFEE